LVRQGRFFCPTRGHSLRTFSAVHQTADEPQATGEALFMKGSLRGNSRHTMKREIKFRAWDGSKMLSFGLFSRPWPYSMENPIMQFTGQHDKNGKDIYDIAIGNSRYEVYDSKNGWSLKSLDRKGTHYAAWNGDSYEVIGNVYQNPESLKA
jgi:hypothetical protein